MATARPLDIALRPVLCLALCLAVLAGLAACGEESPALRLHSLAYRQVDVATLREALADEGGPALVPDSAPPGTSPLEALAGDWADLAIVDNSTPFVPGVRTVIPLYPSVLHLLVRDGVNLARQRDSGETATVYIANDSRAGRIFVELVARRARLLAEGVERVDTLRPGETDAIVYFGPVNPASTPWYQEGYHLVSLDSAGEAAAEFLREGVSLLVPQMRAMEVPALTYNLPGNERPLQSLSVSTLLVARREASEARIYELTRMLVEQRARFAALEPDIFSWVSEHFDREKLNFPLHDGARRYLERDAPGLLERYANTINLLVYLAILLATGLAGFLRWRAQRKKNRVDTFYSRLLAVRERMGSEPVAELLEEVRLMELEAYSLLIDEKLAADESFRIFTDLLDSVRAELRMYRGPVQ